MARRSPEEIIKDLEKKSAEMAEKQKAINKQITAQKRKLKEKERKERTKRLIEKGGCIEKVFPETKSMSSDDFFSFVKQIHEILERFDLKVTSEGVVKK